MLFNVYYLNFSKVYEIKMMLSNVIKTDESVETNQGDNFDAALQAKMGTKFLKMFSADVGADVKSGSSDSQKVLESFKVTMTKSLILSEVMEKCKEIKGDFEQVAEGQLVRIDNVSLSLENEKELRSQMDPLKECGYQKQEALMLTIFLIRCLRTIPISLKER